MSAIFCAFVSFRSSFFGEGCKDDATHRYNDMDLCRAHWIYESGAYPICGLCKNSRYEDAWVAQAEHTCYAGDQGWDCMHFEDVSYCDCESEAKDSFESAPRTPAEPVAAVMPENWECQECEDGDAFCTDPDSEYCDQCAKYLDWKWARTGYDSLN